MKFFAYAALILGAAAVRLQQKEAAEHITPPNTQELQIKTKAERNLVAWCNKTLRKAHYDYDQVPNSFYGAGCAEALRKEYH